MTDAAISAAKWALRLVLVGAVLGLAVLALRGAS